MGIRGSGRVAFLARKEEIHKMIDEGYPFISIYEKYENKLSIGYSQFMKYVRKFILGSKEDENEGTKPESRIGYNPNFSYYAGRYDALKPEE